MGVVLGQFNVDVLDHCFGQLSSFGVKNVYAALSLVIAQGPYGGQ